MKCKILISCILLLAFMVQTVNAQEKESKKRKMTIVTKTIDENGKETVTTIVKEGDEVTDEEIDKLMNEGKGKRRQVDVEVEVEDDGGERIIIREKAEKGVQQEYRILKKSEAIEVEGDDDLDVIILDKDGEHGDGTRKMIFINEDGEVKEINAEEMKAIRKKMGNDQDVDFEFKSDGDEEMIWIQKEGDDKGDIIIIEEKTTIDKGGKTVKKKKKKVKKKEKQ